jgi:septal ring factor EnvC (AmiA/AmiB activator)
MKYLGPKPLKPWTKIFRENRLKCTIICGMSVRKILDKVTVRVDALEKGVRGQRDEVTGLAKSVTRLEKEVKAVRREIDKALRSFAKLFGEDGGRTSEPKANASAPRRRGRPRKHPVPEPVAVSSDPEA